MKLNIKGIIWSSRRLNITPDTFYEIVKIWSLRNVSWRGLETAIILFFVWYFISKNRNLIF